MGHTNNYLLMKNNKINSNSDYFIEK